jgi:carboxylesterase type B
MVMYDGDNTYKGKPLFRAGIMNSGTIYPADPVDCPKGQAIYDQVVSEAGCSGSPDTLVCLRNLDYETYLNAVTSVPGISGYTSVAVSYPPRPDGVILTESPEELISAGKYVKIPFIVGDQEDEGTAFALSQSNITTTDLLVSYLSDVFFHDATTEQIEELVALYPEDPAAGPPYNTGDLYELYPQYKRLAALLGDYTFTIMRRVFLSVVTKHLFRLGLF